LRSYPDPAPQPSIQRLHALLWNQVSQGKAIHAGDVDVMAEDPRVLAAFEKLHAPDAALALLASAFFFELLPRVQVVQHQ
jgi:hypothetical protein